MAVSYGAGAFAEGLHNGVSLRNALMQRDLLQAQTREEQEKAQQLGTLVPVNINGQIFNVPQNQAADLMNQQEERRLQAQYTMALLGRRQDFQNDQQRKRETFTTTGVPQDSNAGGAGARGGSAGSAQGSAGPGQAGPTDPLIN